MTAHEGLGFSARVREVMAHPHITVLPHMQLSDAYAVMNTHGIRHLPVVDEQHRLLGLLTEQAVLRALFIDPARPQAAPVIADATVAMLMDPAPPTASPRDELLVITDRMTTERLTCLPVVDPSGRLVGLLTRTDLLRAMTAPWLPLSALEVSP